MKKKILQEKKLLPGIALDRRNVIILVVGLVVITIGYFLLSIPPWDNFLSRSVSPLILILGYLVIIPIAIFYGSGNSGEEQAEQGEMLD